MIVTRWPLVSGYVLKGQEIILHFFIFRIVVISLVQLLNIYKPIDWRKEGMSEWKNMFISNNMYKFKTEVS